MEIYLCDWLIIFAFLNNSRQIHEEKCPCHFEEILLEVPKDAFLRTRNKFLSE